MGVPVLVLSKSGMGKSSSLRNLNPEEVLLVNVANKPLPFKSKDWKPFDKDKKTGSVTKEDRLKVIKNIISAMPKIDGKKILVIDDFQFAMSKELFGRIDEKGYEKWSEIAKDVYDIVASIKDLPDDYIVYILTHTDDTENGEMKVKTVGKLIDNQVNIAGWVTVTLGATKNSNGEYKFITNSKYGFELCKSPIDMFPEDIDNDLNIVTNEIRDYYGLK